MNALQVETYILCIPDLDFSPFPEGLYRLFVQ